MYSHVDAHTLGIQERVHAWKALIFLLGESIYNSLFSDTGYDTEHGAL